MDFFVYVAEMIGMPVDQVFIHVTPIQILCMLVNQLLTFNQVSTILRIKIKFTALSL